MQKLDPALCGLVERRREDAGLPPAARARAAPGSGPTVSVAIKFTGDIEDLRQAGFEPITTRRHPTEGWTLSAGRMPVERLEDLEAIDHVVKVEGSRPLTTELNRSIPEIGADVLHQDVPPFKGAGVVVGIIDSGFDWKHHSLRLPNGKSRILGLWDQGPPAGPGSPAPYGFGVAYTKDQIDADLEGGAALNTTDPDGHGTHVAGIAAGDGSQSGNCRGDFTFVGVAPEADLILVAVNVETNDIGASLNLTHALDFIWHHPGAAGKAVAVNVSLGDNMGPHDGTSFVEQFIDLDLTEAGRAIVKSAGNEGDRKRHAEGTVPTGGSLQLDFEVRARDGTDRHLELWFDGAASLDVAVRAPGDPAPTSPVVHPGDPRQTWTVDPALGVNRRTQVRIDSRTNDPDNGDDSIHVELVSPAVGRLPAGPWAVVLTNTGAADVVVDAWIERGRGAPRFTSHVSRAKTISIPGTSASVITVGAYDMGGFFTAGGMAPFSSFGPTRDGRTKPDLVAPGVAITSARGGHSGGCCCDCCYDFYVDKQGTSMSAPHVTGAIALMFQKNPALTAAEVKEALMDGARQPSGVDPADLPNSEWGAGELDAEGAVGMVPDPGGGSARGGGGSGRGGGGGGPRGPLLPRDDGHTLLALHRRLVALPDGEHWAALVSRHFSEVRGLVNANPRVAVKWHRLQGPALLRVAGHAALGSPRGVVLPALDLAALPERLAAFLDVLERHGSAALVADARLLRAQLLAFDLAALLRLVASPAPRAA